MAAKTEKNKQWVNFVALGILLVCYVGALANVFGNKKLEQEADVVRLVHWQLELGVRDGLKNLIQRFEAMKKAQGQNVRIVQIPIPERAYKQYVTTQLIGGTAPDMIQIGKFPNEYIGRYFLPMTKAIQGPNEFLPLRRDELRAKEHLTVAEAKELEALERLAEQPWMNSFTDGLRSMFMEDFQEYFGVGFSTFTVRMFYNKDLFREVFGHDRPPKDYRELLRYCAEIKAYGERNKTGLLPVASSSYQVEVFRNRYLSDMTADLNKTLDLDMNGGADGAEKLMAVLRGELSPWDKQYRAALQSVQYLADFFRKGFMSLGREDAGFDFVQGRAAMITSGSWDALSFLDKIAKQPEERRFEVGIFDLPTVGVDDPEFGAFADGRSSEASAGTGFSFGITRFSRNEALCIEFLKFCTTPENNTLLNQAPEPARDGQPAKRGAGWIPVVHGASVSPLLENFQPNYIGNFGQLSLIVLGGGKTELAERQTYWPYISGDESYEGYAKKLWEQFPRAAAQDYHRLYTSYQEALPSRQARRSAYLADVVFNSPTPEARQQNEIRLARTWESLIRNLVGTKRLDRLMAKTLEEIDAEKADTTFNQEFFDALERGKVR